LPQQRPKHAGEYSVNKIHHKHWSVLCWLFIYYRGELMSGNQEDGAKRGLSLTKINCKHAQKKKVKQGGDLTWLTRLPRSD